MILLPDLKFKQIAGGQIILTYGTIQYMLQPGEDGTYNLLVERELINNPKRKTRYKLIGNFKDIESIIYKIKNRIA
jgi:hypothetical protein